MRNSSLLFFLAFSLVFPAFGQSETSNPVVAPADTVSPLLRDTTRGVRVTFVDGVKLVSNSDSLPKGIDIRWGWSMLSDDGTFFLNPLLLDNWQNVTMRPLPATFSAHFPLAKRKNGSITQLGIQTLYSASEAAFIGGDRNYGTAHYAAMNVDFRNVFPTLNYLGSTSNFHLNYGIGYTYRSVALHKHEPIVHLGFGVTSWFSPKWGVTLSGIGNFGTIHMLNGYTSYLQATAMATYRL
jgi:hypothetical protein